MSVNFFSLRQGRLGRLSVILMLAGLFWLFGASATTHAQGCYDEEGNFLCDPPAASLWLSDEDGVIPMFPDQTTEVIVNIGNDGSEFFYVPHFGIGLWPGEVYSWGETISSAGLGVGDYPQQLCHTVTDDWGQSTTACVDYTVQVLSLPILTVSPLTLAMALPPDSESYTTLTLSNEGGAPFTWWLDSCGGTYDWLTVTSTSGELAPWSSATVDVSFNSDGLTLGENRQAQLCVAAVHPELGQFDSKVIDVSLSVNTPTISVAPATLDLQQAMHAVAEYGVTVANVGAAELTYFVSEAESGAGAERSANRTGRTIDAVHDGSFELPGESSPWQLTSSYFGTPLCNVGSCRLSGGSGPHSGGQWIWLGGIQAYYTGEVSQEMELPVGTATLTFYLEHTTCNAYDAFEVLIDDEVLMTIDQSSGLCGLPYQYYLLDVSHSADGGLHRLTFRATTYGYQDENNRGYSTFFLDDVQLLVEEATVCQEATEIPWLSYGPQDGTLQPGESATIAVQIDTRQVDIGVHQATLCFGSNDPASPWVEVPVNLTVVARSFMVSPSANGTAPNGLRYADEDILRVDTRTGELTLFFDGSDVGIPAGADVDAVEVVVDGSLLLSFDAPVTIRGVAYDDSDILHFVGTQYGATTAGDFSMNLDGSDVGLTTDAEDIDTLAITPDGRLAIGTLGSFSVPSVNPAQAVTGLDEDLLVFNAYAWGNDTAGYWEMLFDGSDVGLTDRTENVWGAWIHPYAWNFTLNTMGLFNVPTGVSGDGNDTFTCSASSLGNVTACTNWLGIDFGAWLGATAILDGYSETLLQFPGSTALAATAVESDAVDASVDDDPTNGFFEESVPEGWGENPEAQTNPLLQTERLYLPVAINQ